MTKLEDDLNALFKLPLNEFIAARKTLAAQLKKSGHGADAERVKLLAKPSLSVWAVNQLYWNHREPFDDLLASGQRFRKAQAAGKIPEMRDALDARREALAQLSKLATELLSDARSNPSLDTIRRITSTLEAVSAYASLDGQTLGRLTKDVDPPGFESFASSIPAGATKRTEAARLNPAKKTGADSKKTPPKSTAGELQHRLEEARSVELAAAKLSLQTAKRTLSGARAKSQSLESQQKKTDALAKEAEKGAREAEKESRDADARFKKASATAEAANRRARTVRDEVTEAKEVLAVAQQTVEKATKELESLFQSTR